ncbi:LysR family transcriptional regulator [Photobacterium halotolerans]|uniref:LysR family transcriptional regulator n=1 Tax=Photobacterium halotolerans TaxID=265726 RepID=UPI0003F70701|nr:LysR family transcriptional regulator [Photobacterium halotolerans]
MAKYGNPISDIGKERGHNTLNWDDARIFLAIARSGTLSGASKALGIGLATTSRRIERLEAALGLSLFIRDQIGYRLTDEGVMLIAQAEALEQAGHAFGAAAQGSNDDVAGHVRLATAQGLADHLIIPALPRLMSSHTNLTIEVVTGVSTVNLHRYDADMAIRMVRPERGNVSIRRLGELGFGLYASQEYLQQRAAPENGGLFEDDDFIGWSESQQHLPAAQWLEKRLRGKPCRLTTTSMSSQVTAAQAGAGIAVLPHFIAQKQGLACVQSDIGCSQPIWLAIHSDLAHSRRVRLVADFLSELVLQNNEQLVSGHA